jgi:hypothetical protein
MQVNLPPSVYRKALKVEKYGRNPAIATGDVPEDIWDVSGAYTGFVAAAATTTIVSTSTDDDGEGTPQPGARTVFVEGLDTNYLRQSETVTLNGTAAVTLDNDYLRVFCARVETVGNHASGTNVGNIQVKHGSTVLAQITAGFGQTQMAIYTVPNDWQKKAHIVSWCGGILQQTAAATAEIVLDVKPFGGAWLRKRFGGAQSVGVSDFERPRPINIEVDPKSDIRMRVTNVSATVIVTGGFDICVER